MKPSNPHLPGQIADVDLRLLRVFKSVVECGGMAAAELELNVGTSTISRQIKDLETRLGFTLCRRGRAGFALTVEGQRIYEETMRLLSAVDAFRSGVDEIHQRRRRPQRVGEVAWARIGDDQLLQVDDVGDEKQVDDEKPDEQPVELAVG